MGEFRKKKFYFSNAGHDRSDITKSTEQLHSSSEADVKLKHSGDSEPTVPSIESKTKKFLDFHLNEFVPSAAPFGVGKQADPQQVSAPIIHIPSTPAALPSVTIPMKLPKMLMDKCFGISLEWPEWFVEFPVSMKESFSADRVKMSYLRTLIAGKAEAATEGNGYSGSMYHAVWQTLEHDFGKLELGVELQLKKIHVYPFIKPQDSIENVKYSLVVSGSVNVLTKFATNWTLVDSQC